MTPISANWAEYDKVELKPAVRPRDGRPQVEVMLLPQVEVADNEPGRAARQRLDDVEGGTVGGDVEVPHAVEFVDHMAVVDDLQLILEAEAGQERAVGAFAQRGSFRHERQCALELDAVAVHEREPGTIPPGQDDEGGVRHRSLTNDHTAVRVADRLLRGRCVPHLRFGLGSSQRRFTGPWFSRGGLARVSTSDRSRVAQFAAEKPQGGERRAHGHDGQRQQGTTGHSRQKTTLNSRAFRIH